MSNVRVLSAAPLLLLLENWLPPLVALMPLLENGACWSWPPSVDTAAHATVSFFFAFAKGIVVWLCFTPQVVQGLDQHGRHFACRAWLFSPKLCVSPQAMVPRPAGPPSKLWRACVRAIERGWG